MPRRRPKPGRQWKAVARRAPTGHCGTSIYIEILKLPHPKDPTLQVWAVQVNLVHTKDLGGKLGGAFSTVGSFISVLTYWHNRKRFIFYKEPTLAYCLVHQIVALAFAHQAFRRTFTLVQQLLCLTVPAGRDVLQVKFELERPLTRASSRGSYGLVKDPTGEEGIAKNMARGKGRTRVLLGQA